MHTVIADACIKEAARMIKAGQSVQSALAEASRGASGAVRSAILDRLAALGPMRHPTPENVRERILATAHHIDQQPN